MIQPDPNDRGEGVLRRMLRVQSQARLGQGGAPQLPPTAAPTAARAAATAIGRAADRLYKLPVRTLSVRPGALTLAELPELLPDLPLIAVLQGPGDSLGSLALCPQAVAGLVEWQALGRVTSRGLERRRPSRSDALLCAEFIDTFLKELPAEMAGVEGFEAVAGFSFMTHLDDPRPLTLMLEDGPFRSLSFDLGIGAPDMREGKLLLALPQPAGLMRPRADAAAPLQVAPPAMPAPPPAPRPTLAAAMQDAPIQLSAILCRRHISLAELRAVMAGRLLTLPRNSLTQATLETSDGQVLAVGKLGEAEGCHALRLRDPAQPAAGEGASFAASPGGGGLAGLSGAPPPQDLSGPDPFRDLGGPAPVFPFPAMTGLSGLGG